MESNIISHTIR